MEILLSPYLTLVLSIIVLYKWVLKAVYSFSWTQIGAIVARFVFCVVYAIIVVYEPNSEDVRLFVRAGLNVLFIDEVINWSFGGNKFQKKICGLITKLNNKFKRIKQKGA
jgi:hypothetical protein